MTIESFWSLAANQWLRGFKKNPWLTAIATLVTAAGASLIAYYAVEHDRQMQEAVRQQTLDYQTQLTELSRTEASLRNLTDFVQSQKTKLRQSEDLIANLKAEHERLKPFVEGDRKVVQAVFDLQEQRQRDSINRERWIGFGLGILASIVTSIIYTVARIIRKRLSRLSA